MAGPLEHQFARIAYATEMTSTSMLGSTSITLQFELSRDIDGAARDVQGAISAARGDPPANLPNNPTYRKINLADAPILILSLTSDIVSRGHLYDVASSILQQKLSQVEGVGQVTIGGATAPGRATDLNPTALNKYGIGLGDVRRMLSATNVNRPKGQLKDGTRTWEIRTNDQLHEADDYSAIDHQLPPRSGRASLRRGHRRTCSVEDLHDRHGLPVPWWC
ncbi:MAG: efflux RND transporter permease subunit [Nitrospiraceae bacterium]